MQKQLNELDTCGDSSESEQSFHDTIDKFTLDLIQHLTSPSISDNSEHNHIVIDTSCSGDDNCLTANSSVDESNHLPDVTIEDSIDKKGYFNSLFPSENILTRCLSFVWNTATGNSNNDSVNNSHYSKKMGISNTKPAIEKSAKAPWEIPLSSNSSSSSVSSVASYTNKQTLSTPNLPATKTANHKPCQLPLPDSSFSSVSSGESNRLNNKQTSSGPNLNKEITIPNKKLNEKPCDKPSPYSTLTNSYGSDVCILNKRNNGKQRLSAPNLDTGGSVGQEHEKKLCELSLPCSPDSYLCTPDTDNKHSVNGCSENPNKGINNKAKNPVSVLCNQINSVEKDAIVIGEEILQQQNDCKMIGKNCLKPEFSKTDKKTRDEVKSCSNELTPAGYEQNKACTGYPVAHYPKINQSYTRLKTTEMDTGSKTLSKKQKQSLLMRYVNSKKGVKQLKNREKYVKHDGEAENTSGINNVLKEISKSALRKDQNNSHLDVKVNNVPVKATVGTNNNNSFISPVNFNGGEINTSNIPNEPRSVSKSQTAIETKPKPINFKPSSCKQGYMVKENIASKLRRENIVEKSATKSIPLLSPSNVQTISATGTSFTKSKLGGEVKRTSEGNLNSKCHLHRCTVPQSKSSTNSHVQVVKSDSNISDMESVTGMQGTKSKRQLRPIMDTKCWCLKPETCVAKICPNRAKLVRNLQESEEILGRKSISEVQESTTTKNNSIMVINEQGLSGDEHIEKKDFLETSNPQLKPTSTLEGTTVTNANYIFESTDEMRVSSLEIQEVNDKRPTIDEARPINSLGHIAEVANTQRETFKLLHQLVKYVSRNSPAVTSNNTPPRASNSSSSIMELFWKGNHSVNQHGAKISHAVALIEATSQIVKMNVLFKRQPSGISKRLKHRLMWEKTTKHSKSSHMNKRLAMLDKQKQVKQRTGIINTDRMVTLSEQIAKDYTTDMWYLHTQIKNRMTDSIRSLQDKNVKYVEIKSIINEIQTVYAECVKSDPPSPEAIRRRKVYEKRRAEFVSKYGECGKEIIFDEFDGEKLGMLLCLNDKLQVLFSKLETGRRVKHKQMRHMIEIGLSEIRAEKRVDALTNRKVKTVIARCGKFLAQLREEFSNAFIEFHHMGCINNPKISSDKQVCREIQENLQKLEISGIKYERNKILNSDQCETSNYKVNSDKTVNVINLIAGTSGSDATKTSLLSVAVSAETSENTATDPAISSSDDHIELEVEEPVEKKNERRICIFGALPAEMYGVPER